MEINRASLPAAGRRIVAQCISIVFPFYYFTERSGVYFYSISIVFLQGTWYLVHCTIS
jgi:hypothetical protein